MYRITCLLLSLILFFVNCKGKKSISDGVYLCEKMMDSSKYTNSFCFYEKIEFKSTTNAIVYDKTGKAMNSKILKDDNGHLIIVHSKYASENLILTAKINDSILEGKGFRFIKIH